MELRPFNSYVPGSTALDSPEWTRSAASRDLQEPVIVVGGGPSGLRTAQEVARRGQPVVLFNAERWAPYNRVKLTPFLAGEVQIGRVFQPDLFVPQAPITLYDGQTVVAIDRVSKSVFNQFGRQWRFSKLVLCLGSSAYIPPIQGRDLPGVFRFRNFDDVERLVARAIRSRRTVVIGGGLLGLEAARGMAQRKVEIVVVEHEIHLMARQLDGDTAALLQSGIERMGLRVRTGCSVKAIEGDGRVELVRLSNGDAIECDTVIICTGIRSNIELAREAGISVGRGITVDGRMRTSDPDIYAVGECAEHEGHVYGLVAPGLEQATVAAADIAGEATSYRGSVPTTKLKVIGTDVFSMGDVEQIDQRTDVKSVTWRDSGSSAYRRIVMRRHRIVGALGVGPWPELNRVQQAVRDRALLLPWHTLRFVRTGRLYPESQPASVKLWPSAATVCNCTGVTRGQLGDAIAHGASSAEALMRETSASTVCGSCRPLLHDLLGAGAVHQPMLGARTIATVSAVALLALLAAILLPAWPYSSSVADGIGIDLYWTENTWKQISGYSLVSLSLLIAALSVRKRIKARWLGDYRFWRVIHAVLGAGALAVLFMHTGFNLGSNLNLWLMLTFLTVAAAGSLTGFIAAREHTVLARGKRSSRTAATWIHILAFWPFPLLLMLHVVTVYAY
jgi:nitrite reductase (NADH) large subunit